jgi:hypothetical protein
MPIKASDTVIRPVLSILSKGRTGTGKTIASCGKEFRPVYVLDCEGRFRSVINYYNKLDGHCKDIEYDTFHMEGGFYVLDKKMDELSARCEYKTVVVTSLTSFIHIVLRHLIQAKAGQKTSRGFDAVKRIGGIPVNALEDYNAEDAAIIFELIGFLKSLQNQGVNIILEAHISPYEITTIEDGGRVTTTINQILTKGKKAPAQIPGYFDEVYLFEKKFTGMGSSSKAIYEFTSTGSSTDDCKTSNGIVGFDWTGKDFSVELMNQLSNELKETPRVDPNLPKAVKF